MGGTASSVLRVVITGEPKGLLEANKVAGESLDKLNAKGKSAGQKFAQFGKAVAAGALVAGAAVVGFALKAGNELEDANAKLDAALKSNGSNWDKNAAQIKAADKAGEHFGYTSAQTNEALASGVVATGSAKKAYELLATARNVAAKTGKPLSDSMVAVAKASEGQLKPLKALGIDLPVAAGGAVKLAKAQAAIADAQKAYLIVQAKVQNGTLKGKDAYLALTAASGKVHDAQHAYNVVAQSGSDIMDALNKRVGGQAASAADTFSGKVKAVKAQVTDWAAALGLKLIPLIEKLVSWIQSKLVPWMEKHQGVAKALAIVVGGVLVAAVLAYAASMVVAAANTIIAMAPVIAIAAVVGALTAAIVWAWTHWDQIWNWIAHHKGYAAVIAAVFPITGVVLGLVGAAKYVSEHWSGVWAGIGSIARDGANLVIDATNLVIQGINDIIQAYNDLPFHKDIGKVGYIAHLSDHGQNVSGQQQKYSGKRAAGGPVLAGHAYLVGERGPEIFAPDRAGSIIPNGAGGTTTINVTVTSLNPDDVVSAIKRYVKANGQLRGIAA